MQTFTIMPDIYVQVDYYPGVAMCVLGPSVIECYSYDPVDQEYYEDYVPQPGFWDCVMVGDDDVIQIEECYIKPLDRDEFCGSCGQVGCGWH